MKFNTWKKILTVFLTIFIVASSLPIEPTFAEATGGSVKGRLEDGGFENLSSFTGAYSQFTPGEDKPWKTTAVTNKIELFRTNAGTYIKNVVLKPSEGTYAAELNADEESSMYQIVNTEPSSLYEWGLDHGARTESETMALIIGPNQDIAPSKSWGEGYEASDLSRPDPTLRTGYKYGRDQMMQMVDWLKATGVIGSTTGNYGIANHGEAIILYSKKFGEHGTFLDNMDNQPFSMTPSSVYTEKWYIWLMTDKNTTVANAENPWTQYGVNGDTEAGSGSVDLSKYYLYYVPSGQTKTLFAFTSVDNSVPPGKTFPDPTYGNFLDNVNFNLYRLFSGSSTSHGTVIMGHSDGSSSGGGGSSTGHVITSDSGISTYIPDGDTLHIQAIIENDEKQHVRFAGIYYTTQNETGTGTQTHFVPVSGSPGWTKTEDTDGNLIYAYDLPNVTSALNLHFVFVKSPLLTYDVNGGKPYLCTPSGSNVSTEPDYVYSFMPGFNETGTQYVSPYTSHAPVGQNDGWKFTGWKLFDDAGEKGMLPDVHTIACSYHKTAGEGVALKQQFTVAGGTEVFQEQNRSESGIEWVTTADKLYDDSATGLALVAQWRWRQIFSPQTDTGTGYIESNAGGNISVLSASGEADENYVPAYNAQGAKAYFAEVNETVSVKATPEEGYYFVGWYDTDGNLVDTHDTLTYVESKENMSTYYARFALKYTQTFKRQIQSGDVWTTLADDDTTIPLLDHVILNESKGSVVSSTATNNTSYGLIGWYDASGNPVDQSMLYNDGKTIRYPVAGNAVYYARYSAAVTVNFKMQFKALDGTLSTLDTTNDYGYLSTGSISAITGETVTCKAYAKVGYKLIGWFDGPEDDATQVTFVDPADSKVITPVVTEENGKTYYARFAARDDTRYIVYHNFQTFDTSGTPNGYTRLVTNTYYGTTGELVTPTITPKLYEEAQKGYIYSSGIETKPIQANGNLTFNLYYTKTKANLTYNSNAPSGVSASGTVAASSGYVGHTVNVSADQYSIAGYRFNGWNTKADGTGIAYDAGDEYTLQATPDGAADPNVLYAQWVPESSVQYKVQHIKLDHLGNEIGAPDEETHYGATNATVTAAVKSYVGYSVDSTNPAAVMSGTILGDGSRVLKVYYKPNPAVLTYKANNGIGADYVVNGYVNQSVTVATATETYISRPGYTFTGWKTPGGIVYAAGSGYTLSADDNILLAQWSANTNTKYTVNHYKVSLDGLSAVPVLTEMKYGKTDSTVTAVPAPPAGYTYKSDFNSNGMKNNGTGVIVGDGSLILNLYYIPSTANLVYDANGGSGSNVTVSGRTGETAVIQANMFSRAGYTFTGWNTEAAGTGTAYAVDDIFNFHGTDTVLFAQWSAKSDTPYKVHHYKTNAAGSSAILAEEETLYGTTDAGVPATSKSYAGYHFDDENPGNVVSGTVAADGSLVLKLYYKPNAVTLTYKANGGEGADATLNSFVDETITAADGSAFSRNGYTFAGWNTAEDGSGTSYSAGGSYTLKPDGNILYAQWNANTGIAYKVQHFKTNAAGDTILSTEVDNYTGSTGQNVTAASKAYAGYHLDPANTSSVPSGTILSDGSLVLKLYYKPNPVTLTYKANGGEGADDTVGGYVDETVLTADGSAFSRAGYTFTGWNTAENGSGTSYSAGGSYTLKPDGNILYAQWNANTGIAYKVQHFKTNAAGDTILSTEVDNYTGSTGQSVTAAAKAYAGYHLDSANTSSVPSGAILADGSLVLKLYYKPNPVTLTYKANGGEGTDVTVGGYVDETITMADGSAFSRNGYTFAGWNTAEDGSGTSYSAGSSYKLHAGSNILYAQWNIISPPPIGPIIPIVPIVPDPSDPSVPTNPSDPGVSTDPDNPGSSEDPGESGSSDDPSAPGESGSSGTSDKPGDSKGEDEGAGNSGHSNGGNSIGFHGNSYEEANGHIPKTGDSNNITLWLLLLMASETAMVILLLKGNSASKKRSK